MTRTETTGPITDRIRIVGAEPAGEVTQIVPAVSRHVEPTEDASDLLDDELGGSQVRLTGEPANPDPSTPTVQPVNPGQTAVPGAAATTTELPHWTEPPTGQVPAVLARDTGGEGSGSGIASPSWREEDTDWMAHDEEFEPAMFGDDREALGSLDETEGSDPDRRPWEFDLDSVRPGAASPVRHSAGADEADDGITIAPITEPTAVVSSEPEGPGPGVAAFGAGVAAAGIVEPEHPRSFGDPGTEPGREAAASPFAGGSGIGPVTAGPVAAAAGSSAGAGLAEPPRGFLDEPRSPTPGLADDDDLKEIGRARPSGTAGAARARRTGLLPSRLRAKRPDDVEAVTDTPLAAEPPGASVTDVPGAGRKRGSMASLAAADRSAEREDLETSGSVDTATERGRAGTDTVDIAATAAVAAGVPRRRPRRWSVSNPSPVVAGESDLATGGGPPPRRSVRTESAPDGSKRSSPRQAGGGGIGIRVGTGIAVAVIALVAFKLGTVTSLALCLIVITFAAGESFGVLRRAGYHPATLLGLVGTISLMVGAYNKGIAAIPLILVLITAFTLIWYLFGIERGSPVAGTAATLLTVGWVSLLGGYAGLLLSPSMFPDRHGIAFLLGAIIATVANDVGALVIGGGMGRHALAPNISPNKTWEGLIGGALFSILASTVIVGQIHPWTPSNAAVLGVVVAVVAPIGDLCESLLKRDLRLKDMGTLLPGHGGVLDRVDALLFVLPATYYLVRALNLA